MILYFRVIPTGLFFDLVSQQPTISRATVSQSQSTTVSGVQCQVTTHNSQYRLQTTVVRLNIWLLDKGGSFRCLVSFSRSVGLGLCLAVFDGNTGSCVCVGLRDFEVASTVSSFSVDVILWHGDKASSKPAAGASAASRVSAKVSKDSEK